MKFTFFLNIIYIILFLSAHIQLTELKEELKNLLKNYSKINSEHENFKNENGDDIQNPFDLEFQNVSYIANIIRNEEEKIGSGGQGQTFTCDHLLANAKAPIKVVAKEVLIKDTYNSSNGKQKQNLVYNEIMFNQIVDNYDGNRVYFPQFYGAYDMTGVKEEIAIQNNPNLTMENIDLGFKDIFLLMELLDFNLGEYFERLTERSIDDLISNRLLIGEQIAKALLLIIKDFTHCDIKPQNIMFKKLNEQERQFYTQFDSPEIELFPNEFYLLKLIDFGLVAHGNVLTRKCISGTAAYKPPEHNDDDVKVSSEKFDVFSLAVTMLDMENTNNSIDLFNMINGIWIRSRDSGRKLTLDYKNLIQDHDSYKFLLEILKDEILKSLLNEKIHEYFAEVDEVVQISCLVSFEELDLKNDIFEYPFLIKFVLGAALEIHYTEVYYAKDEDYKVVNNYIEDLEGIVNLIEDKDSEEYLTEEKNLKYYKNLRTYKKKEVELYKTLIPYYMEQIMAEFEDRDDMKAFYDEVTSFKLEFEESMKEVLTEIVEYRRQNGDGSGRLLYLGIGSKNDDNVGFKQIGNVPLKNNILIV
jgi:serine/threonine protein kinase